MEGYLGEREVDIIPDEFAGYTSTDWAMYFIERYGQIEGEHHKLWIMDQVARILKGSPIIIKLASWSNSRTEYRISVGEPSQEYKNWVCRMKGIEEREFDYDEGIAP